MSERSRRLLRQSLQSKRRVSRWPRARAPKELERSYQRDLLAIVRKMKAITNQVLVSQLPKIVATAVEARPVEVRQDDAGDAMSTARRLMDQIKRMFSQEYTATELARIAMRKGMAVSEFNREALEKGFKRVAGVDVIFAEKYLQGELQLFVAQNVNLIESLSQRTFAEIEERVYSGLSSGTRWENISDQIEERFGVSESRANLIARDQVNKINGQLNQLRQGELGVTKYIWRTSLDERVRDAHERLEGTEHRWDTPPSEGHPGEAIQCRCTAEPVLDEFLAE